MMKKTSLWVLFLLVSHSSVQAKTAECDPSSRLVSIRNASLFYSIGKSSQKSLEADFSRAGRICIQNKTACSDGFVKILLKTSNGKPLRSLSGNSSLAKQIRKGQGKGKTGKTVFRICVKKPKAKASSTKNREACPTRIPAKHSILCQDSPQRINELSVNCKVKGKTTRFFCLSGGFTIRVNLVNQGKKIFCTIVNPVSTPPCTFTRPLSK